MRRGGIAFALCLACSSLCPASASAQPTDTAIKAAFLPRFARYVTWPPVARPRASEPYVLCVIGTDPFGSALDQAARGQAVDGVRIVTRRLSSARGSDGCHIAFVGRVEGQSIGELLTAMSGKPILTVTDARHGSQRGIIHFTIAGGRVRFFIDEAAASRRNLAVSSRLLALALGVRQR